MLLEPTKYCLLKYNKRQELGTGSKYYKMKIQKENMNQVSFTEDLNSAESKYTTEV